MAMGLPCTQSSHKHPGVSGGSWHPRVMTTLAPPTRASEDDPWATADDVLTRVATGDRLALAELYDGTAGRVFGLIRRTVGDPIVAEAVLQGVYVDVWTHAPKFDARRGSALLWLGGVVRRRLLQIPGGREHDDSSGV